MKNIILWSVLLMGLYACKTQQPTSTSTIAKKPLPRGFNKDNTWVFIMAGQSNMAGRGVIEAQDTVTNRRIWTIDASDNLVLAKEPLHFYEPNLKGLDCGLSFANTLIKEVNKPIDILIIPTAVGGSSIGQWLGDSTHRKVALLTNFYQKMELAKQYGTVKAILWHQGESDANELLIPKYADNLRQLFTLFRTSAGNDNLPILIGELGSYSKSPEQWSAINQSIKTYMVSDMHSYLIQTGDFKHKGDNVHFDSEGQRAMGQRFAEAYLRFIK